MPRLGEGAARLEKGFCSAFLSWPQHLQQQEQQTAALPANAREAGQAGSEIPDLGDLIDLPGIETSDTLNQYIHIEKLQLRCEIKISQVSRKIGWF